MHLTPWVKSKMLLGQPVLHVIVGGLSASHSSPKHLTQVGYCTGVAGAVAGTRSNGEEIKKNVRLTSPKPKQTQAICEFRH